MDMESDDISTLDYCTLAVQICELVIGFFGNLTACIVILCCKSMRTLTDIYLLSLSTSDLLILILSVSSDIIHFTDYFRRKSVIWYYENSVAYCFHQWVVETAVHASILTMVAFTVERYLAIFHPFLVQSMAKGSRAKKIIAAIWMFATLLAILPAIELYFTFEKLHLTELTPIPEAFVMVWPYLVYIRVVAYFIVPMFLITVMYIMIGIKLNQTTIERQSTSQVERTNTKALKMFALIILLFFISWAPYYAQVVIWYYILSKEDYYDIEFDVTRMNKFTYALSATLNPIIYVIMSRKFRKALKDLLSKSRMKLRDWTFSNNNTNTTDVSMEIVG